MNNQPYLQDLRVFCVVVRRSSFVAAAEALGASPAYVTKRIQSLEERLGVRLLHRSTRRIAITEAGERVYQRAQSILDEVDHMMEEVSVTKHAPRGLIRISSSLGFGRVHVAPALALLAERYPDLEIRFDVSDRLVDLTGEGIDLDIRIGNEIAPHLIARRLASNRRILCASPAYLERRGTPRHLSDLAGHDCLVIKERDHPFGVWRLNGPDGETPLRVTGRLASNHDRPTLGIGRSWDHAQVALGRQNRARGKKTCPGSFRPQSAGGHLGGISVTPDGIRQASCLRRVPGTAFPARGVAILTGHVIESRGEAVLEPHQPPTVDGSLATSVSIASRNRSGRF